MSIYLQGMSSCAVQEIVGLSEHSTPEDAMLQFCRKTLGDKGDCGPNGGYRAYRYIPNQNGETPNGNKGWYTDGLGENYVFHGVEDGSNYGKNGYASTFAAYITEQKLGQVYGGDPVKNHRYHPDHITRVFVFNPDREAVKAWWAEHKPKPPAPPKHSVVLKEAKDVLFQVDEIIQAKQPLARQIVADIKAAGPVSYSIKF